MNNANTFELCSNCLANLNKVEEWGSVSLCRTCAKKVFIYDPLADPITCEDCGGKFTYRGKPMENYTGPKICNGCAQVRLGLAPHLNVLPNKNKDDVFAIESSYGATKFSIRFKDQSERDKMRRLLESGRCEIELRVRISEP